MDYDALLKMLREKELDFVADDLQRELANEWGNASSVTVKRLNLLKAKTDIADTVRALLEGKPAAVEGTRIHKLAQSVVEALRTEGPREPLEAALKAGHKLKIDYDDGIFSARIGETVADGETMGAALTALRAKLSGLKGAPPEGVQEIEDEPYPRKEITEYAMHQKRKR